MIETIAHQSSTIQLKAPASLTCSPKLNRLPVELLGQIATFLDPNALRALSRTNRGLREFVSRHGWRAFVLQQFSDYKGHPLWSDAAHSLTRQIEAWDSRALNAHIVLPERDVELQYLSYIGQAPGEAAYTRLDDYDEARRRHRSTNAQPQPQHRRRQGQTMGYQPVLDVVERWAGPGWTDRREILAVGAGAEILVRTRDMSQRLEASMEDLSMKGNLHATDDHEHRFQWSSVKEPGHKDGLDDVTALKILNRGQDLATDAASSMIVGRASGKLERVSIPLGRQPAKAEPAVCTLAFDTDYLPVRFMDFMPGATGSDPSHFAVGLGNTEVALYSTNEANPLSSISVSCGRGPTARTWATGFLSSHKLAVGHGISANPLDVYAVRPDGLDPDPLRRFSFTKNNAVYAVAGLPGSSGGGGNVFVAGTYDGSMLLHDLRVAQDTVARFVDASEAGTAVYSVLPVQEHLVLAGTAMHSKICAFDIRRGGATVQRADMHRFLLSGRPEGAETSIYLSAGSHYSSSVYSLARAGAASPTVYAGLEGSVMQMDVFSSHDRFPDPIFRSGATGPKRKRTQRAKRYVDLSMFYSGTRIADREESESGVLLWQAPFGRPQQQRYGQLDERWMSSVSTWQR